MLTIDFEHLKINAGDRILDLGCGEGRHSLALAQYRSDIGIIALDLCRDSLNTAQQRACEQTPRENACLFIQGDGCRLPFEDNSFDHILCSEVLEHIPQYKDFLKEMNRLLKPGGQLAISVPRAWPERICWWLSKAYHQVEGGHVRIFSAQRLRKDVQQHGFKAWKKHGAHALHVPYWWLRCLFWRAGDTFFLTRVYHRFLLWDLFKRPLLCRCLDYCLNPIMGKSVVMYFEKHRR